MSLFFLVFLQEIVVPQNPDGLEIQNKPFAAPSHNNKNPLTPHDKTLNDIILDKIFTGSSVHIRSEQHTRSIQFKPAEDINDIVSSIHKELERYPFMRDKIKKDGIELYINEDLMSQIELTKRNLEKLLLYANSLNSKNIENNDITEISKLFEQYLKEKKKLNKIKYRKKIIAKAIQMKFKRRFGIYIPLRKIKVHPIDINKTNNSLMIKQNWQTTKKNLLWRAPGTLTTVSLLLKKAITHTINPWNAASNAVLTIAINIGFSFYTSSLLKINKKLSNKYGRWAKMAFSVIQGRLIEMSYRIINNSIQKTEALDLGFAIKLSLNTLDNIAGTFKKDGLNTLVDKGYMTTQQSGVLESALRNLSPLSQMATGFSGDPTWDAIYWATFVTKIAIFKAGTWIIAKVLPAQTKLILLSLGQDFYEHNKKEKTEILKSIMDNNGLILSDSFVKVPQLSKKELNIQNTFLEYNLLLADNIIDDAIKHFKDNTLDTPIPEIENFKFSMIKKRKGQKINYKDILFHPDFGLIPVISQNIENISISSKEKFNKGLKKELGLNRLSHFNTLPENLNIPDDIFEKHKNVFLKIQEINKDLDLKTKNKYRRNGLIELKKNQQIITKAIKKQIDRQKSIDFSELDAVYSFIDQIDTQKKLKNETIEKLNQIYYNENIIMDYKHLNILKEILNIHPDYSFLIKSIISLQTWCM